MVEVSDKLTTQMITKVINRFKTKAHLYTYGNLVSIFETMAVHVLNKFEDSIEFQSEVQKNMKKVQLIHMGLTAFFMMTLDKNKTPAVAKDRCTKIMQLITKDNYDIGTKDKEKT